MEWVMDLVAEVMVISLSSGSELLRESQHSLIYNLYIKHFYLFVLFVGTRPYTPCLVSLVMSGS